MLLLVIIIYIKLQILKDFMNPDENNYELVCNILYFK